jgi:tellurite resistance protein
MRTASKTLLRLAPWALAALALVPLVALARSGGGEHYTTGDGDNGDGIDLWILFKLIELAFRYPKVGVPLLIIVGIFYFYQRRTNATGTTRRAIQRREAEQRTQVSETDVQAWTRALKSKDPQFELQTVTDRVARLFPLLQEAWFKRDLTPVRPFLSDATYQRLNVQLRILADQGVRDALADVRLLGVKLIGLEQSEWFDSIHVRVRGEMRDTDVPASYSDEQALAEARKARPEAFTEVWTFVRKPGAQTRIGQDLFQGKCPNCGAPYQGGATNVCEYCQAVVNSGNYDWTLSEITQGVEFHRHAPSVPGLFQARQTDPALNLEILEDRASLLFWKWIDAQSQADARRMAQVASPALVSQLGEELEQLRARGHRRVFLECAVGAVNTRSLEVNPGGDDLAHVEIRWSARLDKGPAMPQRWVFTLSRKHGAKTNTSNGMATDRCPQCNAPLTSSGASTCEFCGTQLGTGERDWVLTSTLVFEAWNVRERQRRTSEAPLPTPAAAGPGAPVATPGRDTVMDVQERERLLYMMASIASSDGSVDEDEKKLLKLCAKRWDISWKNVELALNAGPQLYNRLIPRGSPEASDFLRHLVEMALVDGRVDRKERRMLEAAATHLNVLPQLEQMLNKSSRT